MNIEQKRRELFESVHKDEVARLARIYGAHPSLDVAYDRNEDGLYLSGVVQAAWWGFNAALDAVVIELPSDRKIRHMPTPDENQSYNEALENCRDSIESTGLGLKVEP